MRKLGKGAVVACVAVVCGWALSQQPGGFPGGGFGKGKGGQANEMSLFQNAQVRAELKVTEEQLAKLPEAAVKALSEVLNADQMRRLRGIYWQQKGNAAFLEGDVKNALKLTGEQTKAIQAALDEQRKGQLEMIDSGAFDQNKMQELQQTATAKIQGTLTTDQKSAWTKLLGEPIQLGGFAGMMGEQPVKGKDPGTITTASLAASFEKLLPGMTGKEAQQDWQEICFRVGAPGNEELRLSACKLMAARLEPATPAATRIWLLRQLQQLGRAESVTAVAALLNDPDALVRDSAVRCLANIQTPEATQAVLAKLPTVDAKTKIGLLNSLARRGDKTAAIPVLAKELTNPEPQAALAAARALGKIAAPEAVQALAAARPATTGALRLALNDAYLTQAERLLREEKNDEAAAIYKALNTTDEPPLTRVAAFQGLLETAGGDTGALILNALSGGGADLREVAVARISQARPSALKAVAPALGQKLLELAQDQASPGHRFLALQALARVAALPDERPPLDKLNLLKQALKLAQREDERRVIVAGFGHVPHIDSLRSVTPFLEDKALGQTACQAVVDLAGTPKLRAANQAEFTQALDRVIALSKNKVSTDLAKHYKQAK
jgi:HEAT repeat protein